MNAETVDQVRDVLRDTPALLIEFGVHNVNLLTGEPYLWIGKPGATPRAKATRVLPLIFGSEGSKPSDLLELIAGVLREVGR